MKKVTLLLLMLVSGTVFAQTATAPVSAEIIQPITVSATGTLNFGAFLAPTGAESVTVTAAGVRSFTNSTEMAIPQLGTTDVAVPTFTVSKDADLTYKTTLEVTTNPETSDASASMTLGTLTSSEALTGSSASTFTVGGTLSVAAGQTTGVYTGEIKVTVAYE